MINPSLLLLVLCVSLSCTEANTPKVRVPPKQPDYKKTLTLESWLRSLPGKPKHYTSVFVLTPNDCNSCMELFTAVLRKQLNTTSPNNRICVVFQDFRPVERPALIQAAFEDIDTSGVPIIWSDTLFEQARQKVNQPKGGSLLLVYNQKYQLLYSKAGKSVTGTEPELKNIFN